MTLGEKIKQARLEAGLSQRQLCGEEVTRNMLSQIENGAARPSMDTLAYFAARLGKPISYFLEEDAVYSPNQELMRQARTAVFEKNGHEAARLLSNFRMPDPVFDTEAQLLLRARAALDDGEPDRCAALLEAAQDQEAPQWNFLRAELYLTKGQYAAAAKCFHKAEQLWPERCAPRLELCYRELGDFQQAYAYACKQR